ncbi:hypothetical protein RHIZ404_200305 [Rhizobium sp. EC-SD404]|nr:hypothetical protein RHIZ404_200305 [Rhizobium sp. EC-SD404]
MTVLFNCWAGKRGSTLGEDIDAN